MMIAMFAGITTALRSSVLHGLHPLPDLVGYQSLLNSVVAYGIGPSAGFVMTTVTIAMYGALLGVLLVLAGSALLLMVGWIFGVSARYRDVRAALVWAFVPYTWLGPVWVVYGLIRFDALRQLSFPFGTIYPWQLPADISWLLYLDYAARLFSLIWLVLKLSVAMNQPIWKVSLIVFITLLPAACFFAPWQRFGF